MPSHSILIVEDENITALELQEHLKSWNYHVAGIVSNGTQAVQKAVELKPDLILMDIILKGDLDGIDTAEQIHANLDIPIIYVTAYADKHTLQRAKISAPYGYVLKPFDERELQIVLEMALYKHRTEQELRHYREALEELVQARTLELQQAKEEAEAANNAKTAFMTNISHEFFTPLNGILGYIQLLQKDTTLNQHQQNYVDIIRRSGDRLLKLVRNILDVTRMESQSIALHKHDFLLSDFLKEVSQHARNWTKVRGLEFRQQLASELPEKIYADRVRLQQVLLALLDNAVTFSETGHVTLRVRRIQPVPGHTGVPPLDSGQGSQLRFEIEDTGPGIPEALQEPIFTAFKQADEYLQKRDGKAGLGLALSRGLIRRMGSELILKSVPGEGSLFYFDLDLSDNEEAIPEESQPASSIQEGEESYIPLPEQSLLSIYELAVAGDMYEIMRYLEGLGELEEPYIPFVRRLQQLSASFNINRLRHFLENFLSKDTLPPHEENLSNGRADTL